MLKVVSVSLGSSSRDKSVVRTFLGQEVELSRIGTDGDMRKAAQLIGELDGKVDAIGLGGIDLYLIAANRKYTIRDAKNLAAHAKTTPVVDGSGLKTTLELQHIHTLAADFPGTPLKGAKALLVSGVDRWGMAEGLDEYADEVIYGDLLFGLGIPIPIRSLATLSKVAQAICPIVTKLPFHWIYPTGSKQKEHKPKHVEHFIWADWICGDYHYIRRNLPERLDGKVVLTNTTTADDQADLKARGLSYLVTTTPVIDGRSFGMNVLEGCLAALIRQAGDIISPDNYQVYINKLKLGPDITKLN